MAVSKGATRSVVRVCRAARGLRKRLLCRNEPLDSAPGLVRIWSVGPLEDLIAYVRAVTRITRESARQGRWSKGR